MIRDVLGDVDDDRDEALGSVRPALQKLTLDAHDLIHGNEERNVPGVAGGFDSRAELIRWEQQLAIRSLGEVPMFIYQGIASQLASARERPLAGALLADTDTDARTAAHWRTRMRERVILPAFDRAFRRLRSSANDYATKAGENDEHQPLKQRYIAMRPGLDELNEWQRNALQPVLEPTGFESPSAILDWSPLLTNATHGEKIRLPDGNSIAVSEFVARAHDREPWRELLTEPDRQRVRETWAARFLIPTFNAGVRELTGTSGEVAQTETDRRTMKSL